jgi:hypothetical protein
MSLNYSSLLTSLEGSAAETKNSYDFLTERHIQVMWYEQKYFKNLESSQGEPIRVLSAGIWNTESGPDFLKAHIKIGEKDLRGDVEIHFVDDSWEEHQHHLDKRYDQVILHLSFWKTKNSKSIYTSQGKEVIRAYLDEFCTISISRIVQLIDLDTYPYKQFVGSGKCAQTLFRTLPKEKIEQLFGSASEWRLMKKQHFLAAHMTGSSLQLLGGIAMSLGYKANAEAFLNLFISLLPHQAMSENELIALSLGVCGFFDDSFEKKWGESAYYQNLREVWKRLAPHITQKFQLRLDHIRPLNHPIRRLVYLIKLLKDTSINKLYLHMSEAWSFHWSKPSDRKKWSTLQVLLREMIPTYEHTYWNRHFTFETKAREIFLPLLGNDLKDTMMFNTFLPLLYQEIVDRGDAKEKEVFMAFYKSFRAIKSGKIRYLSHRFFGDTEKSNLLHKAQMAQGALQLHRDFCFHFESSCVGCPFVERYKALF